VGEARISARGARNKNRREKAEYEARRKQDMKSFEKKVIIISNRDLKHGRFILSFSDKQIAGAASPGQFLMVKVSRGLFPLLRRPFSIHNCSGKDGRIDVLYEVKGPGSRLLSQYPPGRVLEVVGPLGNGFSLPEKGRGVILVAGGMGAAPLFFLASRLAAERSKRRIYALLGACGKNRLCRPAEFTAAGCSVKLSTDDGSCGSAGYVSGLLDSFLNSPGIIPSAYVIYACGPRPMLQATAFVAGKFGVPGYCSLEAHMACGIGACMGCVIPVRSEGGREAYKRVCHDGPVFSLQEPDWGKM